MITPIMSCACKLDAMIDPVRKFAERFGAPLLDLAIRLFMANIFFKSGWQKFQTFLNDDWGSTVYLFQDIHPLPGIPAEIAAVMGTGGELGLSILLALGLFGRFGAAGLLVMTTVIQFVIPASYGVANADHYMWMMLLAVILVKGPGALSLDHLLRKFMAGKSC